MLQPDQALAKTAAWLRSLVSSATGAASPLSQHYVMAPVRARVDATQRAAAAALRSSRARNSLTLSLSALSLRLSEAQLRDASRLFERLTRESHGAQHEAPKLLPEPQSVEVSAGETHADARAAWVRAGKRIRRERMRKRGWRLYPGFFEARRAARVEYVELYRRSLQADGRKQLSDEEAASLERWEKERLAAEDIFFFRSVAEAQARAAAAHSSVAEPPKRQTWYEWATGRGAESVSADEER
eukprot:1205874-Pleurochrysis_carterae.AAC.1